MQSTLAGSYTNDFASSVGAATITGNAALSGGQLLLTANAGGQYGTLYVNDLDPGTAVSAFTATFNLTIAGSGTAADGFSFNFANPSSYPSGYYDFEVGAGTGLQICVATYVTNRVFIKVNGVPYGSFPLSNATLADGTRQLMTVSYSTIGGAALTFRGQTINVSAAALTSAGFTPQSGYRFLFGARTGGATQSHHLDDVTITTNLATLPATAVTVSSATLNGVVNPQGMATTAWFEYGTDAALAGATSTVGQDMGSGSSAVAFSQELTGLVPDTTYYFRAVVNNSSGTARGAILSFVTGPEIVVEQPALTNLVDGAASVGFGNTPMGTTSAAKTFTVRNLGSLNLTGLAVTVDGDHPDDYAVSSLGSTTVAPGGSTTFSVTFRPGVAETRTAVIHLASNDSDENPFDITLTGTGVASTIWTGPRITFTKVNYADWSDAENQDRLTPSVWLTRQEYQGIFNIATEDGYNSPSPADTEWAYGTTANLGSLTFRNWRNWHGRNPLSTLGQNAVLHLISENIYIDIKFLSWQDNGNGGGFSYERSTPGTVVTPEITVTESGNGVADGDTCDFGSVDKLVPAVPLTKTFTIKNDGEVDLTGIVVHAPTGAAASDYTIGTAATAATLSPGASTTFTITFSPGRIGTRVAAVVIDSSDLDENPFNIALTGAGTIARDVLDGWTVAYGGTDAPATTRNGLARAVAVQKSTGSDAAVAVFATGYTSSAAGGRDIYTAKYHPVSGALLWEKTFNGAASLADEGTAIVVDGNGDVLITGYTGITSLNTDVYVAKHAGADGALLWQKTYAGAGGGTDCGTSVAVDAAGNVAVAGYGVNASAGMDVFAARYSADGSTTYFERLIDGGSSRTDTAYGVAVDTAGNLAVAGHKRNASNNTDFWVLHLAAATGSTNWEHVVNGSSNTDDGAYAVAFDATGAVIATGYARAINYDIYTVKLASGGGLLWEKQWNGPFNSSDTGYDLVLDSNGDVIVGGVSYRAAGVQDGYVVKYSGADGSLVWDRRFDGPAGLQDSINSVDVDVLGNVVAAGYSQNAAGNYDVLTAKMLAGDGGLLWEKRHNGAADKDDSGAAVAISPDGNVFVGGYSTTASSTTDFLVKNYQAEHAGTQTAQTITFANPGPQRADTPLGLAATSSSGLTVRFAVVSGPAVIDGTSNALLNFTGSGAVRVRASQSGSALYAAAAPVEQTFTVNKAAQTLSFTLPAALSHTAQWPLSGVASSGLPVSYSVFDDPGGVASISGGVLSFTGAGTVTVRASQAGDARYDPATAVDAVVTVNNTAPIIIFDDIMENWRDLHSGSGAGEGNDIALQLSGNDAVAGFVAGHTTTATGKDLYLAKYLADGTLKWSVTSGASGDDAALSVAVDGSSGDVVVAGYVTSGAGQDIYVAKHRGTDGLKLWSYTYNGAGNGNDVGVSLALSATHAVVGGYAVGAGTSNDFFAAKLDLGSGAAAWASLRNRSGASSDVPARVAVGTDGSVVLAGISSSDAWTVKFDSGGVFVWQQIYNYANKPDAARGLALDGANNVIIAAYSQGTNYDMYTAKYAAADGTLIWGRRYNSSFNSSDAPWDMVVDEDSNVFVTGASYRAASVRDGMTLKYAGLDGSLLWEGRYNGVSSANDENFTIALDGIGNPVISGYTTNADGTLDVYLAKHNKGPGNIRWQRTFDGANNNNDTIKKVRVDPNGNVWMTGSATSASGQKEVLTLRHVPSI